MNTQKQILVTGGLGYIGSHTVVELQQNGYSVVIVDNLSNSDISVLQRISEITGITPNFEQIDICDSASLDTCFTKYGQIDAVIHFAAYKAVGESVQDSLAYYKNNVYGLMVLLEAIKNHGTKHLVFSSSCTVYGQPDILPVTEETPMKKAESPYGYTKQVCEQIIQDAIISYSCFSANLLRYFNPIGAHETALIGELPKGIPNNLVPYITQTAAKLREQLQVFGGDYNTPDGSAIRDYIYVVDLAKAHVKSVNRLVLNQNESACEIFNLGTGNGYSVLELVNAFMSATQVNVPYKIVDRRAGDIEKVWADTTLANQKLGWTANTPLETILASAWKWEKNIRGI